MNDQQEDETTKKFTEKANNRPVKRDSDPEASVKRHSSEPSEDAPQFSRSMSQREYGGRKHSKMKWLKPFKRSSTHSKSSSSKVLPGAVKGETFSLGSLNRRSPPRRFSAVEESVHAYDPTACPYPVSNSPDSYLLTSYHHNSERLAALAKARSKEFADTVIKGFTFGSAVLASSTRLAEVKGLQTAPRVSRAAFDLSEAAEHVKEQTEIDQLLEHSRVTPRVHTPRVHTRVSLPTLYDESDLVEEFGETSRERAVRLMTDMRDLIPYPILSLGPYEKTTVDKLTVLSFNAGLLVYRMFGIAWYQNPPFSNRRLTHVAVALKATDADIIALQEVYDERQAEMLIKSLRSTYPFVGRRASGGIFTLHNGLIVLSKFPIIHTRFQLFRQVTLIERTFGSKGMLEVAVDIPGIGAVTFFNVHLASGAVDPESNAIENLRNEQISQVLAAADSAFIRKEIPIIIGDMNTAPNLCASNYHAFIDKGWRDAYLLTKSKDKAHHSHPADNTCCEDYSPQFAVPDGNYTKDATDNPFIIGITDSTENMLIDENYHPVDLKEVGLSTKTTATSLHPDKQGVRSSPTNDDFPSELHPSNTYKETAPSYNSSPESGSSWSDVSGKNLFKDEDANSYSQLSHGMTDNRLRSSTALHGMSKFSSSSTAPASDRSPGDTIIDFGGDSSPETEALLLNRDMAKDLRCFDFTWDPKNPLNIIGPHAGCHGQRCDHIFLPSNGWAGKLKDFYPEKGDIVFVEPRVMVEGCCFSCCGMGSAMLVTLSDHYGLRVELRRKPFEQENIFRVA